YEADRNAKKRLKKQVRGVRKIERACEVRGDAEAEVILGYCCAVRSALTDDGRPPLDACGLKLHERLTAVSASLGRAAGKGGGPPTSRSGGRWSSAAGAPPPRYGRRSCWRSAGCPRRRASWAAKAPAAVRCAGGWAGCWGRWPRAGSRRGRWPLRWATS